MASRLQHIDFSEFAARLHEVVEQVREQNRPILVERDGETYRLERELPAGNWENYDSSQAIRGLHRAVGALADVDVETLLADLRDQRGQDSHGRPS